MGYTQPAGAMIAGTKVAQTDYAGAIRWVDHIIDTNQKSYICATAVHAIMEAREDAELRQALDQAGLIVPDGQPVVWAMRLLGYSIRRRVYGPELMLQLCKHCAQQGWPIYLYGGHTAGALSQLQNALQQKVPGLIMCGAYSPPHRPLTRDERAHVIADINASNAKVVFCGIGAPKQEKWMAQMRSSLQPPILIGVGAAFDFHAGLTPQAPAWMGDHGLEWLYRLLREPRRLWRRYARHNPRFIATVLQQWYQQRR